MYGLKTYYQDGDNLEHVAKAPNFKEMMSFANELYTEGLLDKEWVVNKKISGRRNCLQATYSVPLLPTGIPMQQIQHLLLR